MIKRFMKVLAVLMAVFAVALVVVTPAKASSLPAVGEGPEGVQILDDGTLQVVVGDAAAEGNGWSFDGDHTLTLNGYNGGSIETGGKMTIVLEGENTITPTYALNWGNMQSTTNIAGIFSCEYFARYIPLPWQIDLSNINPRDDGYDEAILTIVGPGSLSIVGTSGTLPLIGIAGNHLNITDDAHVSIQIGGNYGTGIDVRNMYGMNLWLSEIWTDYSGYGTLTVKDAALSIVSPECIYAFDILFDHCDLYAKSTYGNDSYLIAAVSNNFDKGSLVLKDTHGAYVNTHSGDLTTWDEYGRQVVYTIETKELMPTSGLVNEVTLRRGEGIDYKPGWYNENGTWCLYDTDGKVTNAWLSYNGTVSYLGEDGSVTDYVWPTEGIIGSCSYRIDSNGTMTIYPTDGISGVLGDPDTFDVYYYFENGSQVIKFQNTAFPWHGNPSIKNVVISDGVSAGESLAGFFLDLTSLTSVDLSGLDTTAAKDMSAMFRGCSALTSVDLSGFNTPALTNMGNMFEACGSLLSVDLSSFDTSSVTNMAALFDSDSSLKSVNLSNLNTSSVEIMEYMFGDCESLTVLDLTSFDTSHVTFTSLMFFGDKNLKKIYVGAGWSMTAAQYDTAMFDGCTSLVGGNGTKYNASYTDATYARIDASGKPGYLSAKIGFVQEADGWYYYESNGTKRINAWAIAGSAKYYCGEDGKLVIDGWIQDAGKWYYFDATGKAVTSNWRLEGSDYYYFGSDSAAYTNQWLSYSGTYYYFGDDAKLLKEGWVEASGTYYYISNYKVATNMWVTTDDGTVYLGSDGKVTTNGWASDNGTYYYMGADGHPVANQWAKAGSTYYYIGADSKVVINDFVVDGDATYYMGSDGKPYVSKWLVKDGAYFYFGSNGKMVVNDWVTYSGNYFYMGENGNPLVSTSIVLDGTEYFFNASGVCTGYEAVA